VLLDGVLAEERALLQSNSDASNAILAAARLASKGALAQEVRMYI
jgi:hypothetical protein